MLDDGQLQQLSREVRAAATQVLALTNISKVLEAYGTVQLLGSYAYDVMLQRDIDFHVIVPKLDSALITRFFSWAVDARTFEYISFHDKHAFNAQAATRYPTNIALDSYYVGLRLMLDNKEWQIGVNFITSPQSVSEEIVALMQHITPEQRLQILRFKYALQERGDDISSAFVYRAVVEQGARTMP